LIQHNKGQLEIKEPPTPLTTLRYFIRRCLRFLVKFTILCQSSNDHCKRYGKYRLLRRFVKEESSDKYHHSRFIFRQIFEPVICGIRRSAIHCMHAPWGTMVSGSISSPFLRYFGAFSRLSPHRSPTRAHNLYRTAVLLLHKQNTA
jgi:hypothetical protein